MNYSDTEKRELLEWAPAVRRSAMFKLVLLRHGESQWNLENRFTGWTDVDLTENGMQGSARCG